MPRLPAPGPVRIPSTFEAKLRWSDATGTWVNVFHYRYSTPPTFGTAFADEVFTNIKAAATSSGIMTSLNVNVIMEGVDVKDLNTAHLPSWPSTGAALSAGGLLEGLPQNVAVEITLRTAQSGKGFIGRKYFGGLDQSVQIDARHFAPGVGTAFRNFVDTLRTNPPTNSTLALGRRELLAGTDSHGNPLAPRPADSLPIVRVDLTDTRFDSQRRRLGR